MFKFKVFTLLVAMFFICQTIQAGSPMPTKSNKIYLADLKVLRENLQKKANLSVKEQKVLKVLNRKITRWDNQNEKRVAKGKAPQAEKSQVLAGVLAFFLGVLGIHRFYLGYTWQGVVQLLTAGGLGIWALIDFIRICISDLKPKDGDYK